MMNIQEMATAAENQLDVKIILMNNEALGLVHQQQKWKIRWRMQLSISV